MITTIDDYLKWLETTAPDDRPNDKRMINPDTEAKFIINADTREVTVPEQFSPDSAIYKDHNSETVYFQIDQYFDNVNLKEKTCVIQYVNANDEQHVYLVPPMDIYLDPDERGKIIVPWTLSRNVTEFEGAVVFSVRFYSLKENAGVTTKIVDYNWSTKPCTIHIGKGLFLTDSGETLPNGTQLEDLMNWMKEAMSNGVNGNNLVDYNKVFNRPFINGKELIPGENEITFEAAVPEDVLTRKDVDTALDETSINPVENRVISTALGSYATQIADLETALDKVLEEMEDMTYVPIDIISFQNKTTNADVPYKDITFVENGYEVQSVFLKWQLSKVPKSLNIVGPKGTTNITSPATTSIEITAQKLRNSADYKLNVTDRGDPVSKISTVKFCDGIYAGAAVETTAEEVTDQFILNLNKELSPTVEVTLNVDAPKDQYIYIALPVTMQIPTFTVGGFDGGFILVKNNFDFINTYKYSTKYNLFRSVNHSLGKTTIVLSQKEKGKFIK